jgi:hypothetical protein
MEELEVVEALLVADQLVIDDHGENHPNDLDFEHVDGDVIVAEQVAAAATKANPSLLQQQMLGRYIFRKKIQISRNSF